MIVPSHRKMAAAPRFTSSLQDDSIFGFLDVDGQVNYLDRALALVGSFLTEVLSDHGTHTLSIEWSRIHESVRASRIVKSFRAVVEDIHMAPEFEAKDALLDYVRKYGKYSARYSALSDLPLPKNISSSIVGGVNHRLNIVSARIEERRVMDEIPEQDGKELRIRIGMINNIRTILYLPGRIVGDIRSPEYYRKEIARLEALCDDRETQLQIRCDLQAAISSVKVIYYTRCNRTKEKWSFRASSH